ncbi:667_t:CDS:1, partial [Racocetra persica]
GKYDRLCNIKKHYDPLGVFTPNRFCICLPPLEIQPSETAKREVGAMELEEGDSADKFWRMVKIKREVGKPVPLWDIWRA